MLHIRGARKRRESLGTNTFVACVHEPPGLVPFSRFWLGGLWYMTAARSRTAKDCRCTVRVYEDLL